MRGRQFVAWIILAAFILMMCTACHSAEDPAKDTTGAVQITDAADVSGSAGETGEGKDETSQRQEKERYEDIAAEVVSLRFFEKTSDQMPFEEAQIITDYTELEAFQSHLTEFWTGPGGKKNLGVFQRMVDDYQGNKFEEKALIGIFIQQDNWDYDHEVKMVRDNELNKLEVTVTADRPEQIDYQQDCIWVFLLEVDRAAVEGIAHTEIAMKTAETSDRQVVWSDVTILPVGMESIYEPIIIETKEAMQTLFERIGLMDYDWGKMEAQQYLISNIWKEDTAVIVKSTGTADPNTEFDARVVFDSTEKELVVDVFACTRTDLVRYGIGSGGLLLIKVEKSVLEQAETIRSDGIVVFCTQEDLIAWGLPYGIQDKFWSSQNADLDHDGEMEEVRIYYNVDEIVNGQKRGKMTLAVYKNDECLWTSERQINTESEDKHVTTYFICHIDGEDYLLACYENRYSYEQYNKDFELYSLTEDGYIQREDRGSVWIRFESYIPDAFPVSSDELEDFADHLGQLLADSKWIIQVVNNQSMKVTKGNDQSFSRQFDLLFNDEEVYGDCETIAEKTAVFNQMLKEKWFVKGELPEMPEEFKVMMAKLIDEARPRLNWFEALLEPDRSLWFEDYNGEKIQIVDPAEEYVAGWPLSYPGKIYYRTEAGESPEEATKIMLNALFKHLMEVSREQEMVITDYQVGQQELTSWEDMVGSYINNCWMEYLNQKGEVKDDLMQYGKDWIKKRFYGENPSWDVGLQEDMWSFYMQGNYRYDGGVPTFAERASELPVEDGMVSIWFGDGIHAGLFVVAKMGDVYCMQSVHCWGQ